LEEAKILREKIDARLASNPGLNLIVLGDFNDAPDSQPIKTVLGRGNRSLVDTRPAERTGNNQAPPTGRAITWTHFYAKEDVYSRMDYILLSRSMAREWEAAETYIPTLPNWGMASDHRPLVATFISENK